MDDALEVDSFSRRYYTSLSPPSVFQGESLGTRLNYYNHAIPEHMMSSLFVLQRSAIKIDVILPSCYMTVGK